MEVEVIKTIKKKEIVDIILPYYYKHDLLLDNCDAVIYGKIEENKTTAIHITTTNNSVEYQVEIDYKGIIHSSCYLHEKYSSNQKEYLKAKKALQDISNEA